MATKLIIPNSDFSVNSIGKALLSNDELDFRYGAIDGNGELSSPSSTTRVVNAVMIDCTNYPVKVTTKNSTYIHVFGKYEADGTFDSISSTLSVQSTTLERGYKYRVVLKNGSAGTSDVNLATAVSDTALQPM